MSAPPHRPRLAAAALALALTAPASYALQRLWSWATDTGAVIVAQAHIPYFWRCDVALLHGLVAASLAGTALRPEEADRLVRAGPWLVVLVVGPSALSMVLVP